MFDKASERLEPTNTFSVYINSVEHAVNDNEESEGETKATMSLIAVLLLECIPNAE